MPATDLRESIQTALAAFSQKPLREAALGFFAALGYESDRTVVLAGSKPAAFLDFIAQGASANRFDRDKALFADWKSADLLFQITDDEISRTATLFKETDVAPGLLQSYLFFAIELKGNAYARSKLSAIARQINRVFPMPVMVLLKCGADNPVCSLGTKADRNVCPTLSIAVINRRQNKVHTDKDVLEKVTLIRDISLTAPHRGHLDILASFALPNLVHPQRLPINNFDTLHATWEEIFNVELLNKRFYRELANWYFWALPQVEFPADIEKDDEKRRATGLIRLLTRLIFCWFLKEKGLIPEKLFHPADLAKFLNGFDPESETSSVYYQAILQNLFFATLNQRMGKDGKGNSYRVFATDEGFLKNKATYDINNLYRYEKHFAVPQDEALALFADIPFLNGGLFECLDQSEEGTGKKRYLDGFSRNPKKRPHVPDRLFFDSGETANLAEVYGDKKRKAEKVTGLISILNRYKFTIVENTPIDQEIALDPELLGKVFENLLASYNEETKTTARKQTGSFYTPRPIVEYMVDESLKAHLETKVAETILSQSSKAGQRSSDNPVAVFKQTETGLPLLPYDPEAQTHKTRANLPHWTQEGTTYWVTFRLADSLPTAKIKAWQDEKAIWLSHHPEPWNEEQWKEYDERFGVKLEDWLDAGEGECQLRRPDVRALVEKCLTHFDGVRYALGPWVIMPNHVHLLICPAEGHNLSKILQGIKGVSAKECNALLGRTGQTFWQEESFDHIVRSQAQFDRFVRYIAENPIKAKLKPAEFSIHGSSDTKRSSDNPVADSTQTETRLSQLPLPSKLDQLFSYTDEPHQFTEPEVATLLDAIHTCKILDPACGSGAFPMGMLQKLVYIIHKLDPDNARWKQLQIDAAAKIPDPSARDAAIAAIERDFADNEDDYGRKLYLIENCLYGVDIQPIAIQISKLRFFISLVCDQRTNRNKKENHGIRPLPNLETKFVAADTLIGLPEMEHDLLINPRIAIIEREIEAAYHSHFGIQRRDQKLALQRKIKTLREELARLLGESLLSPAKAKHLAAWNPFDPQSQADFFDAYWMFGIHAGKTIRRGAATLTGGFSEILGDELAPSTTTESGFDIVIGNPPYIQIQKFPAAQKEKWAAQRFATYSATADIYCLFYERALQILRPGGHLCFITSNKWMRAGYGDALRGFLATRADTTAVLDFGMAQNFGAATTYTCIVQACNRPSAKRTRSCYTSDDRAAMSDPAAYFAANHLVQTDLTDAPWVVLPKDRQRIKALVEAQGIPLGKWDIQINYGIKTGFNDAFYLTQEQRDEFVRQDPKCAEILVPLLRGRHVSRYATDWDGTWMIATFPALGLKEKNLPSPIKKHLEQYRTQLTPKPSGWTGTKWGGRKAGSYQWFETQDVIGYHREFSKPKIMYPNMTKFLPFYLDVMEGYFTNDKGFIINSETESLGYLVAFLNSHLFRACFRDNFPELMGNTYEVRKIFIDQIPVKRPTQTQTATFEKLVRMVQSAKRIGEDAAAGFLEDLIDACVMECYFREHMSERDLLFLDDLASHLRAFVPSRETSESQQREFIAQLHRTLNAPTSKIRNRLLRISTDSPDLLAVIKAEGKV